MLAPSSAAHPTNLPSAPTSFVGRLAELAELRQLLSTARLLTLIGPGGCGKTRLAAQIAADLTTQFADGVWWCDLVSVADPAYVPQAVAVALRLSDLAGRQPLDMLTEALRERRLLLVLDNCEHLLAACAALAHTLLVACTDVTILATSLQPLGLAQEQVWPTPPLELPPDRPGPDALEAIQRCDSSRLFVERAREALPGFTPDATNAAVVATICRQLDGLPLALELAAARVRLLTVEQIAARLDDAFRLLTRGTPAHSPRHQALRATLDWAYQFLTAPEQVLLRRLSAFAGPFTLDTVEHICDELRMKNEEIRSPESKNFSPFSILHSSFSTLDLLSNLIDKSFVSPLPRGDQREARYRLLEPVRQYAREKLEESGEASTIRTRLLEWAVMVAEQAQSKLGGPEQADWLTRLDAEQDNLRAALGWVRTSRAVEQGLRLASALWFFWLMRGQLAEGRGWLTELLASDAGLSQAHATPLRARALYCAAALAFRQGDYQHAEQLAADSLNLQRELDDAAGLSTALNLLAILSTERGDHDRAAQLHEEAQKLRRALNDLVGLSSSLINLGVIARSQGNYQRAVELYEEALAIKRRVGDKTNTALALNNLAEIAVFQGDYPRAAILSEESLAISREIDNKNGVAAALNNLGAAARQLGNLNRAESLFTESADMLLATGQKARAAIARLNMGDLARDRGELQQAWTIYQKCLAIFREAGDDWSTALALHGLGLVAGDQGDDQHAEALHIESLKLYQSARYRLGTVEALEALAVLREHQGDRRRAAHLLAVVAGEREQMNAPALMTDRRRVEDTLARLRSALGERAAAQIQANARGVTLDQALAEVLEVEPQESSAAAATEPELRVLALGPTKVIAGQRVVPTTGWTYAKAKELFFYFLAQPPASKAQIGLDLWPDASDAQLRSQFHRAMHYLRKALGRHEWIVFASDTYAFNRATPYWCDLHAFEAQVREARALLSAGLPPPAEQARAVACLEEATQLWRGDFLADLDAGEWAILRREELRQVFLLALLDLGQLHFVATRYASAAACYRRVLAHDNYLELAHRELMRCYARQGETSQALRHYHSLHTLLRDELGTSPSAETALLYERLRRGDDV
jgi:non-specific serine/threonine protein kinase